MSRKTLSNLSKALLSMSAGMRRTGIMDAATHEGIVQRISGKPLSPQSAAKMDAAKKAQACPLCAEGGNTPNTETQAAMRELEEGKGIRYESTKAMFKDLGI